MLLMCRIFLRGWFVFNLLYALSILPGVSRPLMWASCFQKCILKGKVLFPRVKCSLNVGLAGKTKVKKKKKHNEQELEKREDTQIACPIPRTLARFLGKFVHALYPPLEPQLRSRTKLTANCRPALF